MTSPRWQNLGPGFGGAGGLFMRDEADGVRVSSPGLTTDAEIASALRDARGGTWTRRSDWSGAGAGGAADVTSLWARLDTDESGPPTNPMPEGPAIELPIPRGEAGHAVLAAVANLVRAVIEMEKVAVAIARQLDGAP